MIETITNIVFSKGQTVHIYVQYCFMQDFDGEGTRKMIAY